MYFFTTVDSTWLYRIIWPPKKTFVCDFILIISINYSADKRFDFSMKQNYMKVWEWLSYEASNDIMCTALIVISRKGFKWASVSLWTKAIKICAVLSLPQYVIKARIIFFQLVTFLSQMKLFMQVILQLKSAPLKSIHSQECKLNVTLHRITNLEKIRMHIKICPALITNNFLQNSCKLFLYLLKKIPVLIG